MAEDAAKLLETKGYNVSVGSLGSQYKVKQKNVFFPLCRESSLPHNSQEQEIIVLDMCYDLNHASIKENIEQPPDGIDKWWVEHRRGYVNEKPLVSSLVKQDFNRILNTGGVFVIFANDVESEKYYWGHKIYSQYNFQEVTYNNWHFLTILGESANYKIKDARGDEFKRPQEIPENYITLQSLLFEHIEGATYNCTFHLGSWLPEKWVTLLENKFGDAVAGLITPSETKYGRDGWVLILPDLKNKASFTTKLIEQILPTFIPSMFTEQENASWVNHSEYTLPAVKKINKEIIEVREEANLKIAALEEKVENVKNTYTYLFSLLTETGDDLVQAVIQTFKILGFEQVKDVDYELAQQGIQKQNREDLQIHGYETKLILEVKGITRFPSDDDSLAVQKYVVLRMREWKDVNIQGLTIINHLRYLPPLDRDNKLPFRQEILDAAEAQRIGLLTTWDLHRLARSFIQNKWKHKEIKDLFYQVGRINIVPSHYEFIGTIKRFIEKKGILGIQIEESFLSIGDRIAFEFPVAFEEQQCNSLEFENASIQVAEIGMLVGTQTHLTKEDVRLDSRVYKIRYNKNDG